MIGIGKSLIDFLDAYGLRNKITTYVKNESLNLNTMTNVFKSIGKRQNSSLEENFQGHVLGMITPKLINMPPVMKKFVGISNMFFIKST
jgi:hypothetical protein